MCTGFENNQKGIDGLVKKFTVYRWTYLIL
jgi:hypothetical protein